MYLKSVQRHICILLEWGCSVAQSVRSDTERPASPQPCVIVRPLIRPHICTTLLNNPWSYSSVAFGFGWQKTWYMTFLGGAGQEVFYGTVFLLSADIHSWQEQKPAAVYHPSVSPPPLAFWDEYISREQTVPDIKWSVGEHHKPYIIKCHTQALSRVCNWSDVHQGS